MPQHLGTAATAASLPSQGMGGFGTELLFGIRGGEISPGLSPGALPASGPMRKTLQALERAAPIVNAGLSPSWGLTATHPAWAGLLALWGPWGVRHRDRESQPQGQLWAETGLGQGPGGSGREGKEPRGGRFLKLPIPSLCSKSQVFTPGQRTERHRDCNTRQAAIRNWDWDCLRQHKVNQKINPLLARE